MRRDKPYGASRLAALALIATLSFPAIAQTQRGLDERSAPPNAQAVGEATRPAASRAPLPSDRASLARACLVAAAEAEARLGLPPGILAALSLTESAAHPFAIGTAARSHYPTTHAEAVRIARAAGAGAAAGCFQISIGVHAARDVSWLFDPWASALFAGRKLVRHLEATGGDWAGALARYAGARPESETTRLYLCRVSASLAGMGHAPPPGVGTDSCRAGEARTALAKARTLLARANGPTALAAIP
jgi:hypothetical protein